MKNGDKKNIFVIFKFMIFNKVDNVKLAYAVGRKREMWEDERD